MRKAQRFSKSRSQDTLPIENAEQSKKQETKSQMSKGSDSKKSIGSSLKSIAKSFSIKSVSSAFTVYILLNELIKNRIFVTNGGQNPLLIIPRQKVIPM